MLNACSNLLRFASLGSGPGNVAKRVNLAKNEVERTILHNYYQIRIKSIILKHFTKHSQHLSFFHHNFTSVIENIPRSQS